MYDTLKAVHVAAVVLSGAGFLLRCALVRRASPAVNWRHFRSAPHVVDTVLLASGVSLAVIGRVNPLATPWLAAKIAALLLYVAAGAFALRGPPAWRTPALVVAVFAFTYIVTVALGKHALPLAGAPA